MRKEQERVIRAAIKWARWYRPAADRHGWSMPQDDALVKAVAALAKKRKAK